MAWGMPRYLSEISRVPEQFRQIPGHKDDFTRPVTITVSDDTINPADSLINFGIGVAPQLAFKKRLYLRGGVAWNYSPKAQARMDSSGNTREVNLRGTTARGFGESLVYYSIRPSPSVIPSPFAEIETKVKRWCGILGGYMLYRHNLTLERGWDRFDALEVFEKSRLGSASMHIPYLGFRLHAPEEPIVGMVFVGVATNKHIRLTSKQTLDGNFKSPTIVIGLTIGGVLGKQ